MLFEADILSAFSRLKAMERTGRMVLFPVLSDLHTILGDIDTAEPGLRDSLNAIEAVHQTDALFDFDFFADLGDIGLELPQNEGEIARKRLLEAYSKAHHCVLKPSIVCMGTAERFKNQALFCCALMGAAALRTCLPSWGTWRCG